MLVALIALEILIMLAAPVALGWTLRKRLGTPWMLLLVGAVTFIASQVVHLPLNAGLTLLFRQEWMPTPPETWHLAFNAVVGGLSAGLCEETARYLIYHFWLKSARTWRQALMFGAGHGGIESWWTALLVGLTLVNMIFLRDMDLSTLGLTGEQETLLAQQVAAFWDTPPYMPMLATAERLMAILLHLSLAALVMQAFVRKRLWPLWVAIGWHAAINGISLYIMRTWGAVASEAALAAMSLLSAGMLWGTWRAERKREERGDTGAGSPARSETG